jgi:hypothetical protein
LWKASSGVLQILRRCVSQQVAISYRDMTTRQVASLITPKWGCVAQFTLFPFRQARIGLFRGAPWGCVAFGGASRASHGARGPAQHDLSRDEWRECQKKSRIAKYQRASVGLPRSSLDDRLAQFQLFFARPRTLRVSLPPGPVFIAYCPCNNGPILLGWEGWLVRRAGCLVVRAREEITCTIDRPMK